MRVEHSIRATGIMKKAGGIKLPVAMEIAVENDLSLLHELLHHLSRVPDARKRFLENCLVVSIQVTARERAAVVADDNAVRIQHRHDLEYEVVS